MAELNSQGSKVDIEKIVLCAGRFASLLSVSPLSDEECRRVVREVLFERSAFESAQSGLITEAETVQLLLAHLHTALGQPAVKEGEPFPWDEQELLSCLRNAIFG
ncbi:hypothetical protein WMF31_02545 [Sorangium sp. So ce1036]|uniref:hypothetical protein n=1 Tax=Sorangium sp. So ce1036 TaxID=3133328 RepID=UPI003EFBC589